MKKMKMLLLAAFALITVSAFAHDKTDSVKVYGNCGMCKDRIEKAAKIDGVKKADWNEDTKMLTVTYNADKVKLDDIQKSVAAVGHDTQNFTAEAAVYKKLPGCCRYDRKAADSKGSTSKAADNHAGHNH